MRSGISYHWNIIGASFFFRHTSLNETNAAWHKSDVDCPSAKGAKYLELVPYRGSILTSFSLRHANPNAPHVSAKLLHADPSLSRTEHFSFDIAIAVIAIL